LAIAVADAFDLLGMLLIEGLNLGFLQLINQRFLFLELLFSFVLVLLLLFQLLQLQKWIVVLVEDIMLGKNGG